MFGGAKQRPSTAGRARPSDIGIAQVIIAAMAKKKQQQTLTEVLADAKSMPPDMLQYDLIEIKPIHTSSSNTANALMRSGYEQQVAKNYSAARDFFSRAVLADKHCSGAWFCRGVADDKLGDFFKALQDFGNCLKIEMDKVSRRKYNALESEKYAANTRGAKKKKEGGEVVKGEETEAAADTEKEPNDVSLCHIFFNRAMVYVHLGDDEAALSDLNNASKVRGGRGGRGREEEEEGRGRKRGPGLTRPNLAQHDPRNKIVRGARAMIYRRTGNFLKSQSDYVRLEKQKEDERQKKLFSEIAMQTPKGSTFQPKTGKGTGLRPQSAPATRAKRASSAASAAQDAKPQPSSQMTPLELEDALNDPNRAAKAQHKKQLKLDEEKMRQKKRETRGGTLGGLASTIDRTPPASPTKKISVSESER
jgi:tetratricopeptide (TPR) repeat protein